MIFGRFFALPVPDPACRENSGPERGNDCLGLFFFADVVFIWREVDVSGFWAGVAGVAPISIPSLPPSPNLAPPKDRRRRASSTLLSFAAHSLSVSLLAFTGSAAFVRGDEGDEGEETGNITRLSVALGWRD